MEKSRWRKLWLFGTFPLWIESVSDRETQQKHRRRKYDTGWGSGNTVENRAKRKGKTFCVAEENQSRAGV